MNNSLFFILFVFFSLKIISCLDSIPSLFEGENSFISQEFKKPEKPASPNYFEKNNILEPRFSEKKSFYDGIDKFASLQKPFSEKQFMQKDFLNSKSTIPALEKSTIPFQNSPSVFPQQSLSSFNSQTYRQKTNQNYDNFPILNSAIKKFAMNHGSQNQNSNEENQNLHKELEELKSEIASKDSTYKKINERLEGISKLLVQIIEKRDLEKQARKFSSLSASSSIMSPPDLNPPKVNPSVPSLSSPQKESEKSEKSEKAEKAEEQTFDKKLRELRRKIEGPASFAKLEENIALEEDLKRSIPNPVMNTEKNLDLVA